MDQIQHKRFFFLIFLICDSLLISINGQQLILPIVSPCTNNAGRDTYIVHVRHPNATKLHLAAADAAGGGRESFYESFLHSAIGRGGGDDEPGRLVYSYNHAIHGFAARLSENELNAIKSTAGFVRAHRDRTLELHTTHSPDFLGLHPGHCFWTESGYGKGVIIGILDTGIVPSHPSFSHPSFSDSGMSLPTPKWKGMCDFDTPAGVCNSKLIGARGFSQGCRSSPVDEDGHGTHTAGTAAGSFVNNAAVLGQAKGTAAGLAPKAHLAIYKVCDRTCMGSDVLAGIDQAIADGVDVLSISAGARSEPFYDDSLAIGSLAAVANGIFVTTSAGNGGPRRSSVMNDAPWLLTVGASTMDRSFRATVKLGNGVEMDGETVYQPEKFPATQLPLVYPGVRGITRAKTCTDGSLAGIDVRGKLVLCETGGTNSSVEKGAVVKNAGGVAMILMNRRREKFTPEAAAHVIPAAHISYAAAITIKSYMKTSLTPTATILFKGTLYGSPPSPTVASFSGRGPSTINNGIIKPDITGPGVNIVSSWPSQVGQNTTSSMFNILSGTSTSAAHLAGIAALLKASHPEWSPAAIKSAMMTTADTQNRDGKSIADECKRAAGYFSIGAGHINPAKANDPGLIYDITIDDYISYLCGGLGYTDMEVSAIGRREIHCLNLTPVAAEELNYPTIMVSLGPETQKTIRRTVTNVGEANAVYSVQVDAPKGVKVTVYPNKLEFSAINETAVYDVYFTSGDSVDMVGKVVEGQLRWISSKHVVRSPIAVIFA